MMKHAACVMTLMMTVLLAGCASPQRLYVETPNSCIKVERVEGNRVYLKSRGRICLQVIGREPVELDPTISRVELYIEGKFWKVLDLTGASTPADQPAGGGQNGR